MRNIIILFAHVTVTLSKLWGPVGTRSIVAESVLLKHQLLILNLSRKHTPNLRAGDRWIAALCSSFMNPKRRIRSSIFLKPSTLSLFWTAVDLENKMLELQDYFNMLRTHSSLEGRTPDLDWSAPEQVADLRSYRWLSHCRGLYQTLIAA